MKKKKIFKNFKKKFHLPTKKNIVKKNFLLSCLKKIIITEAFLAFPPPLYKCSYYYYYYPQFKIYLKTHTKLPSTRLRWGLKEITR